MSYRHITFETSRLAPWAERFAFVSVPLAIIGVLVTRSGQIDQMQGVAVVAMAAVLAVVALAIAGVAAVEIWQTGRNGLGTILRAGIVAVLVVAFPAWLAIEAIRLPRMNDIVTDIENAPEFSTSPAALAARRGRVPPIIEPRQRVPQLRAYPAIRTLVLELDPEDGFRQVKDAVEALKWQIIDEVPPGPRNNFTGRIDAIAETRLMRFRDDVTIRVRKNGEEVRVDIRSASRIGRHDFGANAARIRRLVEEITSTRD